MFAQGPPIFTDSPILLGLDGGGIRTFGKYSSKEKRSTFIQVVAVPYNLTSDLQIGIVQPFVIQFSGKKKNNIGLGNITFFVKHLVYKFDGIGKTFRNVLKFKQSITYSNNNVGAGFNVSHLEFVTGYITTKFGLYSSVGYVYVPDGLPDKLSYSLSFGYPLLPQKYPPYQINLFGEFTGEHTFTLKNELIFISTGIQFITASTFLIETGLQIPLINKINTLKYTALLGIRYLIF